MAWATPFTWATNDPVTAGKLNQSIRDNAVWLYGSGRDGWFNVRAAALQWMGASLSVQTTWGTIEWDADGYVGRHVAGTALPWSGIPTPAGYHWANFICEQPTGASDGYVSVGGTEANNTAMYQQSYTPSGGSFIHKSVSCLIFVPSVATQFQQVVTAAMQNSASAFYSNQSLGIAQLRDP